MIRSSTALAVLLLVISAGSAAPARAQVTATPPPAPAEPEQPEPDGVEMRWNPRPSLRFGDDMLRIDLRVKVQMDWRWAPDDIELRGGLFQLQRRRVGAQGVFLKHFEYEVERELDFEPQEALEGGLDEVDDSPWRDVFVNFRYFRDAQIKAGKFKVPFSLEQITGPTNLDFVYRSRIAADLAPGRDIGGMVHGRGRVVGYEVGLFQHDGENSKFDFNPGADTTVAGRFLVRPLRIEDSELDALEVGIAATVGDVPEGLNTLRGRSTWGDPFFFDAYVNGRRIRLGAEANWEPRNFSVKSEYIRTRDERREQGILADDLPELVAQGWYVAATWVVTGEDKSGGVEPRRPLFAGGVGAIELAGRYERIRMGSDAPGEPEEQNPRAINLLENGERLWTFGLNWYLNRWVRIQLNGIHETIDDIERSPSSTQNSFWLGVARLQLVL
ncbi:MAG: OprO/OprP family phosphate-selective porin [Vicinamibacterales bacterium]